MDETQALWVPGSVAVLRLVETPVTAAMVHAIHGDPALIQGIPFLAGGKIRTFMARPYIVVRESAEVTVLFGPEGTLWPRWDIESQTYVANPSRTRGRSLRFLYPAKAYDITMMFEAEGETPWYYDSLFGEHGHVAGWRANQAGIPSVVQGRRLGVPGRFRGWYVNMQTPFVRQPYGFDVADQTLDIVVRPDRTWYWKDEDELQTALAQGACGEDYARRIRAAGEEAVRLIESRSSPFDDEWTSWVPMDGMRIEAIPDGWQTAQVLHTETLA